MIIRLQDINFKPPKIKKIKKTIPLSSHSINMHLIKKQTFWQEMKELRETLGDKNGKFLGIKNIWKNEPCFVIGTSKAIEGFDFNLLNGLHTIGMNHLIEDWDKMEWFIYADERFLEKTTYDLSKYKGKIFAGNTTRIFKNKDNYIRHKVCYWDNPTMNIEDGLVGPLTGIRALHLALITGANPIYLLGMDTPKNLLKIADKSVKHHYKKNYTAEVLRSGYLNKYINKYKWYKKFVDYKDRIINVCLNGVAPDIFRRIDIENLKQDIKKIKTIKVNQEPVICHITNFRDINSMNEISRQIFNLSNGKHIMSHVYNSVYPKADIYLLECILRDFDKFIEFKKPYKNCKIISLIHSSGLCQPSKQSDFVVSLTNAWKEKINFDKSKIQVIGCSIDMNYYKYDIDYNNKVYGRITAWSNGKVNPEFNNIVNRIKLKIPNSECIMICNNMPERKKNKNIKYIEDIQRNENEKKAKALSQMSIFADMHNSYVEVFSIALLEAMASGLAILFYHNKYQPSMLEVLGDTGIITRDQLEFENKLLWLLKNPDIKKEYGIKAKERVKKYNVENMVNKWNQLYEELLK